MSADSKTTQPLVHLGLTALEADIYAFLLRQSPVTGYAVAKALGKPAANVYKALETLESKGAVEIDQSRIRLYRPVPWEELLSLLEQRFRRHRDQAAEGLRSLRGPDHDARIYHLREPDQVVTKCRHLIASAQSIVLLDLFGAALDMLREDLEDATKRDVKVALKVYEEVSVAGVEVILDPRHEEIRERWPGQWIVMAVDGSQILISLFTSDASRVVQAVWSSSPFLSWIYHSGLHHELAFTAVNRMLREGYSGDTLAVMEELNERYRVANAEGFHRLRDQLAFVEGAGGVLATADFIEQPDRKRKVSNES